MTMNKSLNIELAEKLLQSLSAEYASGCSRSAEPFDRGLIDELMAMGVPIVKTEEDGFVLSSNMSAMDAGLIRAGMREVGLRPVQKISCLKISDSTNAWLLRNECPANAYVVATAEYQTHGRGRRGRRWISPYGGNLYLSIAYRSEISEPAGVLPLNSALAVRAALTGLGYRDIGIKWPNDLYHGGSKFGGILVESVYDRSGWRVVIGIGVNVRQDSDLEHAVDQPVTSLGRMGDEVAVDRNCVAAAIIGAVVDAIESPLMGQALQEQWLGVDICRDRAVEVITDSVMVSGVGEGIDEQGAFLLGTSSGVCRFLSGDVSLRLQT